jgi:hypothetical protein
MRLAHVFCLLLAACDSPSLMFAGGERRLVEVGAARFAVYRQGDAAEAYRLNPEALPPRGQVLLTAGRAIEAATGCRIRPGSMTGDWSIVRASLECGGAGGRAGIDVTVQGLGPACTVVRAPDFPEDWLPEAEITCVFEIH